MNYKQKYFYTALGAAIMLIGMGVGAIVSPPLVAQDTAKKGVFTEIECRRLVVRDKAGNKAVAVYAEALGNSVAVYNPGGQRAVILSAGQGNSVTVRDEGGKELIHLSANQELGAAAFIRSPVDKNRIALMARKSKNSVTIYDEAGDVLWEMPNRIDKPKRRRAPYPF